ncbi:glycine receptor subunit alpha-2-like isoform X2 [Lycorma delicatula]
MRNLSLIIGIYLGVLIWNLSFSFSQSCFHPKLHRRRPRVPEPEPVFRYRPRTEKLCHRKSGTCTQPLHRHLFLLTHHEQKEQLRRCSIIHRMENTEELTEEKISESGVVLVHGARDWVPNARVLDFIVTRYGNVSVFIENNNVSKKILKYCHGMGEKCFRLKNLIPVLEQLRKWNSQNYVSSTLFDIYDARWFPMTTPPPLFINQTVSVYTQIQQLVASLCVRDKRYNHYVELQQIMDESQEVDIGDLRPSSGTVIRESSLSLKDILPLNPKHYDKNRAPKLQGQPTVVYFHVTVLSLDSINEESMTYVADIFLAQSWRDPRLRLPENMSEEYRILDVGWLHDIWRPDCFFKNAKKVTFHEMSIPNHYLWLYHDKTLLYMSKLTLVLSCAMKFESYPHDTQICSMMIESLSHTNHDLVFIWNMTDPLVVNPEIELPQLDISNNYTADCTIEYSTGNFTCLAVVFNLRRRLGYHLFHTYIPSALIVVMSWISFWIKPEAIPARVTLGVTSLLTLATQNTQSQQSLPPVSYVKAIDIWMSSCSVFVFLSLMEFAVVNNYMGPIATKAMKGYSEEDVRSAVDDLKELDPHRNALPVMPQYPTFCNGREVAVYIDKFSRFFFPFSFFVLNIVYWTSFL